MVTLTGFPVSIPHTAFGLVRSGYRHVQKLMTLTGSPSILTAGRQLPFLSVTGDELKRGAVPEGLF